MKHTPALWTVANGNNPKEVQQIRSTDKVVAVVPHPSQHGDAGVTDFYERQANARLIAAAPELLAALQEVAADDGNPLLWSRKVRAAIAKAGGAA